MKFLRSDPEKGGVGPWPIPDEDFGECAWRLYHCLPVKPQDATVGATVMDDYRRLIEWPRWRREQVVREIRKAMKATAHEAGKEVT